MIEGDFVKWKIAAAVVILLICVGLGYKFYSDKVEAESAKTYDTAKVVRMDLTKTVSATGTVQPKDSVEVSSKVTARIKEILVEENEEVFAGQTVAILDGRSIEAKRDQASFKLTDAEQKLVRAQRLYDIGAKSKEELEEYYFKADPELKNVLDPFLGNK